MCDIWTEISSVHFQTAKKKHGNLQLFSTFQNHSHPGTYARCTFAQTQPKTTQTTAQLPIIFATNWKLRKCFLPLLADFPGKLFVSGGLLNLLFWSIQPWSLTIWKEAKLENTGSVGSMLNFRELTRHFTRLTSQSRLRCSMIFCVRPSPGWCSRALKKQHPSHNPCYFQSLWNFQRKLGLAQKNGTFLQAANLASYRIRKSKTARTSMVDPRKTIAFKWRLWSCQVRNGKKNGRRLSMKYWLSI